MAQPSVAFPSIEFFEALRKRTLDDAAVFEKLGYCDTRFGVRIGERLFSIVFEVYECIAVSEGGDPATPDFVLSGPPQVWTEMLESIQEFFDQAQHLDLGWMKSIRERTSFRPDGSRRDSGPGTFPGQRSGSARPRMRTPRERSGSSRPR